jgi:putative ABC transport system ATP-binding protein
MESSTTVEFKDVRFAYQPNGPWILQDINLAFGPGLHLIKGSSGSGKSTLLRLINRLEEPSVGEIRFHGKPLNSYQPPLLRRQILYIQQTPTLLDRSVRENLLLPYTFKANKDLTPPDDNRLNELLPQFHLNNVSLDDNAKTLSVGQMQRICLIRGLLLSPDVLLLDEPTSALDDQSAAVVEQFAQDEASQGLVVIMVTHRNFTGVDVQPRIINVVDGQVEAA